MIQQERLTTYLNSLGSADSVLLEKIEKEALAEQVPIIRKETQGLLKFILAAEKPARILEVGAAVGYSALLMCEADPVPCKVTTIEKYPPRIEAAKYNILRAGRQDDITLLEGDAAQILKTLEGSYDLVFMDAAKGQYLHFLPDCLRLLRQGGLLISDNVLQDGDLLEPRFAVARRNRTIHSRMREYLYEITHQEMLQSTILPIGDGVALSVKK